MKITAILVLRTPGDASTSSSGGVDGEQQQAAVLANASDVSRFGFFQRPAAREFIVFVARAVALRTATGRRQTVQHEEYKVHCCNPNGLCAVIFTDEHYPDRTAHSILIKVLEEYQKNFGESWRTTKDDAAQPWQYLDDALTKYQGLYMQQQQQQQQQQQATKSVPLACLETGLLKDFLTAHAEIHPATGELIITNETLIELKNKLHKDIASVLERGEQLDILVPKSSDLSAASQMFYNQAKKTRSMCTIL